MNTRLLFPHSFKMLGWLLAIPSFILMIFVLHFQFTFPFLSHTFTNRPNLNIGSNDWLFNIDQHNFTVEVGGVLLIIGLLMIAFSKERVEDERVAQLRMESLLLAVYVDMVLLIVCIILFYSGLFLIMITYNICTTLIFFIVRFNLFMYLEKRNLKKEKL
jgi:hypothetical protein